MKVNGLRNKFQNYKNQAEKKARAYEKQIKDLKKKLRKQLKIMNKCSSKDAKNTGLMANLKSWNQQRVTSQKEN